ncbi:hypothetical protein Vadar_029147 [Vaccinium darrowii]|uniref:Uncharacterized protein n=1 Tax=Vaccinium darrowii TaxID=229202 RepID=A0ACB7XL50_9ERIC|nr:hypothetical protein Vadar_029147 [Vaccinium darrowii]
METRRGGTSVLMLPWLAHDHMSPFLELAKRLTEKNFHIYFCSTKVNLISVEKMLSQKYSHSIQLVELHLPFGPKLPPHYHTTNGLPSHLMPILKMAFEKSKPSFLRILNTLNPDLVMFDFNQPWVSTAASSLNIPSILFLTFGDLVCESIRLSRDVILIKTSREIEGEYIDYLSMLANKKIQPVGPLVQEIVDEDEDIEVMRFLWKKDEYSVVYISFGSEIFLSKEDREEIAHGLELSAA